MSIQHANRGIVKSNLQLYYNREYNKSYRGESVTNLAGQECANCENGGAGAYWVSGVTSDTSTGYKAFKVTPLAGGYQYTPGAWTSTGIIAGLVNYSSVAVSPQGTYSLSAKVLLPKGSLFTFGFRAYPYTEEFAVNVIGTGNWQTIKRENFTTVGYCYLQLQMVRLVSNTTTANSPIFPGDPFWVRDIVINAGAYAKPFASMLNNTSARPENTTNITNNANFALSISGTDTGGTQNGWTFSSWSGTGNSYITQAATAIFSSDTSYYTIPLRVTRAAAGSMDFFSSNWNTLTNGTTYVISFWARSSSSAVNLVINHQNLGEIKNYDINQYWTKYTGKFTHAGGTQYPYLRHNGSNGTWIEVADVQLEAKSYPTDFTTTNRTNVANTVIAGNAGLLDVSRNNYYADLNSSAVAFDGGGFYFNADYAGALTTPIANSVLDGLSNNTHTYEVWFKLLGTPPGSSDGYFFGRQGYHEGFAHFKSTPATFGALSWYFDNGNTGWLSYAGSLNTWYHAAYVVDVENSIRYLYINGSLNSSGALTKQLKQYSSGTVYQLGSANPNYSSNIIVSNAKAYDRALSADEILQNFNANRTYYGI